MKSKVLGVLLVLFAAFSCVKETAPEQPVENQPERLTEYDPVVRFGLETYMGGDEETKTIYAGEDEYDLVFDEALGKYIRYERINWNCGPVTNPEDKLDTVRIWSNALFTKKDNIKSADYSPGTIPGVTNKTGNIKDSAADAKIVSADEKDNFYWDLSKDPRYFFAVYPTPTDRTSLSVTEPSGTPPTVSVSGRIPRYQEYLRKKETGNVIEYLPDMSNAYMYAASKIPSADAGYVKVPLRFKPLFSAVKLKMQSAVGGEKYRLKKVELRTDLFYDDLHQNDPKRVNKPNEGTALNGKFTATFSTTPSGDAKKPEYTGDFTVTSCPVLSSDSDTTYKRLTIYIKEGDRVWLNDEEVNVTFLALPILQEVMTIVYTFEVNDGFGNPEKDDKGKIIEVTRYLALQQKTNKKDNTGKHSEFQKEDWYKLPGATKLYVKSNVPEIQYYFDVFMQGNLPRTWKAETPRPKGTFYEAKNFYAVKSFRDSAGIKQPLRWKVTQYKPENGSWGDTPPDWLHLKGDAPWEAQAPFDVAPVSFTDAWNDNPQGKGTRMKNEVKKNDLVIGYREFDPYSYTYYSAGAPNLDDSYSRKWGWANPGSYIFKDLDGNFNHPKDKGDDGYDVFPDSTAWRGLAGEAYAYDLSSHDIYGKLTADFNGDISHANTANCYVVSAPGWYRFPAVYGNGLKNGLNNTNAYNGVGGDGLMGKFLDYKASGIENPWISYDIESVSVVWDDADCMVSTRKDAETGMDRNAFCEIIEGKKYIYFYVDDIAQGNAVIAAKDKDGKIIWSWHIWAVTNPGETLETIELQSNQTICNPVTYTGTNLLFISGSLAQRQKEVRYNEDLESPRPSCVPNYFWKASDLGQNGKEDGSVLPRYCDVEFTQYFKGKEVKKVVRRVYQSGVEDNRSETPCYQWGRKDPFLIDFLIIEPLPPTTSENTNFTIINPTVFYYGSNTNFPTGKRYDNLWNTNVDEILTNSFADGRDGGSKDRVVQKTIYDPSPVGFVVPNMLAFSGLNPFGPISQVRFPLQEAEKIAYDHVNTYTNKRYVDFYAYYDSGEEYLRKIDQTKTIRFFVRGRIRGSNADAPTGKYPGVYENTAGAYYWTSEPSFNEGNHFFARSFTMDSDNYMGTQGIRLWPVAGTPVYKILDSSGNPTGGTRPAQGKWQRSHGQIVRPMMEEP